MNQREQDYLAVAIETRANRRPVDADLRTVADWREALFCAASNLECGQPQSQPAIAAELRKLADVLVTLSLAASDLTAKNVLDRLRAAAEWEELRALRCLIAGDGHACTFQTMGQYRAALLKSVEAALSAVARQDG